MLKGSFPPDAHRQAEVLQADIIVPAEVARLEVASLVHHQVGVDSAASVEVVPEDE